MTWFVLRAVFLAALLLAIALSANIFWAYVRRVRKGSREARWLTQHITAIALSHLLLLAWATGRFVAYGRGWAWGWVAWLAAILALSNFAIWQMHKYRRWRDSRSAPKETK